MTAPPILRFLWHWLTWPVRRTPTERDLATALAERDAATQRGLTAVRRVADLEARLERRAKEIRGLRDNLDEANGRAAAAKTQVEIMQVALENIRSQYKKDVAIAARCEAFGTDKPPAQPRARR